MNPTLNAKHRAKLVRFAGERHKSYILPATAESYEAQVEAMAKAHAKRAKWCPWNRLSEQMRDTMRDEIRAALAALGIKRPAPSATGSRPRKEGA